MRIRVKDGFDTHVIRDALIADFATTRFTLAVERHNSGKGLTVRNIRLAQPKPYCGSHPAECQTGGPKPSPRTFLEGSDWVELDDRVNDTLDRLGVNADVSTMVSVLRKGRQRRVLYGMHPQGDGNEWNKDEEPWGYADCIDLQAPPSQYPAGTPGSYER